MILVSTYINQEHSKKGGLEDIEVIFNKIKNGTWKSEVEEIRVLKYNFKLEEERVAKLNLSKQEIHNDEKYQKAKNILRDKKGQINRITVGGKFSENGRVESNLVGYSGLLDIDIDKLQEYELKELKQKLILDKYCYSCFITCGGDGLSFICRVDPSRWDDSWNGLKEYFYNKYSISIDISHKNVANTRNVSYDPEIFVCGNKPPVFKEYPKAKKKKQQVLNFVHSKDDFPEIIKEIATRRIDFCPDYETYFQIGAAIASKYGQDGLYFFDAICQWNDKYDQNKLEKDYSYWVKHPDKGIKIGTFYARCKEVNVSIQSDKTKRISTVASAALKQSKTKEDTIQNLQRFEGFSREEVEDIVNQVFDEKIEVKADDEQSFIDLAETFITHNYSLKKNLITGKLENFGVEWTKEDLNGLYIAIKKVYESADAKWVERLIFSPFIKTYNPLHDWFKENKDKLPDELLEKGEIPSIIRRLWASVKTDNPIYLEKYGTKWLVSIVAAAHGDFSNLELDFTGKLHKGKTWFFSKLLPEELRRKYFAESTLDKEKDDEILMTQKLIILINENAGKARADEKRHKRLLDKEIFSLRRPYREDNEDIQRLAVLCGTDNKSNLLSDTTGNRRIIPVNVIGRDFNAYDSIDKGELLMAAYYLWKQGYNWRIKEDEIKELYENTITFHSRSLEYELITKYLEKGNEEVSASEIKKFLHEKSNEKTLSLSKITDELKSLEFDVVIGKFGVTKYKVDRGESFSSPAPGYNPMIEKAKSNDYF